MRRPWPTMAIAPWFKKNGGLVEVDV